MTRSEQLAMVRNAVIVGMDGILGGTMKAILRCIDDHGTNCWASLSTLERESCFNRRTVIRALQALEKGGYVTSIRKPGKTTSWQVNFDKLSQCQAATGDRVSPVTNSQLTSDKDYQISDSPSPKAVEAELSGRTVASTQVLDAFETLWNVYPTRNGRKLGKKQALAEFRRIKPADWPDVMLAAHELAKSEQLPKDCHRWLRGSVWREWLPSGQNQSNASNVVNIQPAGRGRSLIDHGE